MNLFLQIIQIDGDQDRSMYFLNLRLDFTTLSYKI